MLRRVSAPICLLSLIISAAASLLAEPPKAESDAAVSEALQAIEQTWIKAENHHDAATFERIVADDWIGIEPGGKRQTKAERAADIKASPGGAATIGNLKVRVFGDTAVVTGTDDEITKDGKESHLVWTDVFLKRNGKWQAVASQTSPVK